VDRAGRIVLPKPIRDELHLVPGNTLELTLEGEQVTLRPRRMVPALQKERDVWVPPAPVLLSKFLTFLSRLENALRQPRASAPPNPITSAG
jgi:AbrB family looped-hinge helix DNA binding protein